MSVAAGAITSAAANAMASPAPSAAASAAIVVATVVAMEFVAWASHKYLMHGWGWRWHASHHAERTGVFERNDLYAVCFAAFSILLIALGTAGAWPLQWIGAGMTAYGFLYFIVHDGLVHGRWPLRVTPRRGYLKRLVQAHRLHHAVATREGAVSFGFLWAAPARELKQQLGATARR